MKSPITWLPTLMLLGLAAGFASHRPVMLAPDDPADRVAETCRLRQQLRTTAARLDVLEAHPFIPRGGLGPASR